MINPLTRTSARKLQSAPRRRGAPNGGETPYLCELIRGTLWLQSAETSVHTHRIVSAALKIAISDRSPEDLRQSLNECLAELAESGDVISFPKGRWLPARPMLVPLGGDAGETLLIGGLPTHLFPKSVRGKITAHGAVRRIPPSAAGKLVGVVPYSTLNSWTRIPTEDLRTWGDGVRAARLGAAADSTQQWERLEFYLPGSPNSSPHQYSRWKDRAPGVHGRHLCRWTKGTGQRSFFLAELRDGMVQRYGEELPPGFARRFMYAEDLRAGKPVTATVRGDDTGLVIELGSEVPHGERRLFGALGTRVPLEKAYPVVWGFDAKFERPVTEALENLGIKIRQK